MPKTNEHEEAATRSYPCDCGQPLAPGEPMCRDCMDACEPATELCNN